MVATTQTKDSKNVDKLPVAKVISNLKSPVLDLKAPVSPAGSSSSEDEVMTLRARNKVLTDALAAIKESAAKEMKRTYDLVWFARNRYRYPNHEASQRIEKSDEHKDDIKKLRDIDGDFHHGFNSGVLAATRMFKDHANILHINDFEELSADLMSEAAKHKEKINESRSAYPHFEVSNTDFPKDD